MVKLQDIRTFTNRRINTNFAGDWGKTSIIEAIKDIPFSIKRIFYIYDSDLNVTRGGHRLAKSTQALICINGAYKIFVDDGKTQQEILLDLPSKMLIVESKDWHTMVNILPNSILLVISSKHYNPKEYIDEPYPTTPKEIVEKVYVGK